MSSNWFACLISASCLRGSLVLALLVSAFCSLNLVFPVAEAAQLGQKSALSAQQSVAPVQLADYANQLAITLDGRSMLVEPQEGGWSLDMQLESVAWEGQTHLLVGQANITTTKELFYNEPPSYTSKWDLGHPEYSFQEYYHSMSLGVLQTTRLVEKMVDPTSEASFPVTLTYQLSSELVPQLSDAGRGIRFLDSRGIARLNYQMLDNRDQTIQASDVRFQIDGQRLLISVNSRWPSRLFDDQFPAGVFKRGYIKSPTPQAGEILGVDMALSGDSLAVSAPYNSSAATGIDGDRLDTSAPKSGAVYLYERPALRDWQLEHFIKASNTGADDEFGYSVAIYGDTLVVGAPGEASTATSVNGDQQDNSAADSGAVYIFARDIDGNWNQQAYLKGSKNTSKQRFGSSVALQNSTTLVVGAPADYTWPPTAQGEAYVFTKSGTTWSEQAVLSYSNASIGDKFGTSVAIEDDWIAVSAPSNGDGVVALFKRNSTGQWQAHSELRPSTAGQSLSFGYAIDINQGRLAVGAADKQTHVALYEPNSAGTWVETAQIRLENREYINSFGMSLDLDGDRLLVGAPELYHETADSNLLNIGFGEADSYAFLYTRTAGGWQRQIDFSPSDDYYGTSPLYGWSVILQGPDLIISAFSDDNPSAGVHALHSYREGSISLIEDSGAFYSYYFPSGLEVSHQRRIIPSINGKPKSTNSLNLGAKPLGQTLTYTFTISNTGLGNLNFVGTPAITISGTHASDFAIVNQPSGHLARGDSRSFELRFTPSAEGLRTAEIMIVSDDLVTPAYRFEVESIAFMPSGPTDPMLTLFGNGKKIVAGASIPQASDHTDFGQVQLGSGRSLRYTIVNTGSQPLLLTGATLSGSGASQFSLSTDPRGTLAVGQSMSFGIDLRPNELGSHSATVTVKSYDGIMPNYTFVIGAEVVSQTTGNYQIYLPIVRSN